MTAPLHPAPRIGHVHPEVADPERAIGVRSGVLCFEPRQYLPGGGAQ